jgi:4-hydroxybenzoate polyprenyltransferase
MASDGVTNLAGRNKADALVARFGYQCFDYAGNAQVDLFVWANASEAIIVNASSTLLKKVQEKHTVAKVFPSLPVGLTVWRRALRIHQWMKNLLLFIPLMAAHRMANLLDWTQLLLAFLSFSLCASSVYIANDLLDLESDREHPRKRMRPFASAALPIWKGVIAAPLLLALSAGLALNVAGGFAFWLAIYFFITCLYSFKLKQVVLVDCLILAVLYTMRIVAGAAALIMPLSFWLLAFSGALFLSLALVKRFAELQVQLLQGKHKAHGRGYFTDDAPLIQMMGIGSAFTAVLVLALYLNSPDVLRLYKAPNFIWGCVPVMLYWLSWVWLKGKRLVAPP